MGSRRCCCCPICTAETTTCCTCVCLTLCITFTPTDYSSCSPEYLEVDWDEYEQAYVGTLAGHDLRYYFQSEDDEYGNRHCYFKLDSYSLGNHRWKAGSREDDEITCLELNTSVEVEETYGDDCSGGTISTFCVDWITPTECDNCDCLCERICVRLKRTIPPDTIGESFAGFAYWNEYEQAYVGTVVHRATSEQDEDESLSVVIPIDRWGDVCDPDSDYDCDVYDDSCAIGITVDDYTVGPWQKMTNCESREVTYEWNWTDADYTAWEVNTECYNCGGTCEPPGPCVCDGYDWPLTLTVTVTFGGRCAVTSDFSMTVTYSQIEALWIGTAEPCAGTPWTVRVNCRPTVEECSISIAPTSNCDPLNGDYVDDGSVCNPLYLIRRIDIASGWLSCGCCPPDGLPPSAGWIILEVTP